MSLDVSSMPPWRQELMERKKRQEELDRRRREEEEAKLAHMPSWKRDILMKKQQQKHNVIFISKAAQKSDGSPPKVIDRNIDNDVGNVSVRGERQLSNSLSPTVPAPINNTGNSHSTRPSATSTSNSVSDQTGSDSLVTLSVSPTGRTPSSSSPADQVQETTVMVNSHLPEPQEPGQEHVYTNGEISVGEEHLLPVQQNPWLRTDLEKRKKSYNRSTDGRSGSTLSNHASCGDGGDDFRGQQENDIEEDSVFQEGTEFQYGRGFVHKLLRKFSHLSVKEDKNNMYAISTRRTHSSDNILEEGRATKYSPRSPPASPNKLYPTDTSVSLSKRARSMENLSTRTFSATTSTTNTDVLNHIDENPESQQDILNEAESPRTLYQAGSDTNISPRSETSFEKRSTSSSSSNRDSILEEELPKPNIVSNVRNVFESISSSNDVVSYNKRRAPEPPKVDNKQQNADRSDLFTSSDTDKTDQTSQVYIQETVDSIDTTVHSALSRDTVSNGTSDYHANTDRDIADSVTTGGSSYDFKKAPTETVAGVRAAGKSWHFGPKQNTSNTHSTKQTPVQKGSFDLKSSAGTDSTKKSQSNPVVGSSVSQSQSIRSSHSLSQKPYSSNTRVSSQVNDTASAHNYSTAKPVSSTSSTVSPSSPSRKRQAPIPPSQSSGWKHSTTVSSDNQVSSSLKPQDQRSVSTVSSTKSSTEKLNKTDSKRPDTSKLNLNLDLANSNTKKGSIDSNANLKHGSTTTTTTTTTSHAVTEHNSHNPTQKNKRPKRPPPTGPGKLIIRPASNLVIGGTESSNSEYLKLTNYHDVKVGTFAPARPRPAYYDYEDWEGIPITNIDDVITDDVPITNIDDVELSPRWRQDANDNLVKPRAYVFEGAGVISQSCLQDKSKQKQQFRITFNDDASSIHEYPSEQSLLDLIPPEPGHYDFPGEGGMGQDDDDEEGSGGRGEPSTLKSTPGMAATGALSNYKPQFEIDFSFGMSSTDPEEEEQIPVRRKQEVVEEEEHIRPADEDTTWSDSASVDLLF